VPIAVELKGCQLRELRQLHFFRASLAICDALLALDMRLLQSPREMIVAEIEAAGLVCFIT
jgi:hypothetical protein